MKNDCARRIDTLYQLTKSHGFETGRACLIRLRKVTTIYQPQSSLISSVWLENGVDEDKALAFYSASSLKMELKRMAYPGNGPLGILVRRR